LVRNLSTTPSFWLLVKLHKGKHNEIKPISDRKLCQTAIVLHQPLIYIYETAEKSPQQQLQDNMIMSAARTL
jgi:hypothetical protein